MSKCLVWLFKMSWGCTYLSLRSAMSNTSYILQEIICCQKNLLNEKFGLCKLLLIGINLAPKNNETCTNFLLQSVTVKAGSGLSFLIFIHCCRLRGGPCPFHWERLPYHPDGSTSSSGTKGMHRSVQEYTRWLIHTINCHLWYKYKTQRKTR